MYYQNPYQPQYQYSSTVPQVAQNQQLSLIRVSGIEGAKAYQMPPNSTVALFDGAEDILYSVLSKLWQL